jgi:hypothetical protein
MFFQGSFWADVPRWSMESFCETYTLHDSCLDAVIQGADGDAVILIQWDLHWNPTIPLDHNLLAIRFPRTYFCRWSSGCHTLGTLDSLKSAQLSSEDRAALLNDPHFDLCAYQGRGDDVSHPSFEDKLFRTRFETITWAVIEVLHNEAVAFATANAEGNVLVLPRNI